LSQRQGLWLGFFFAAGLFCALIFTVSFASQAPNSSGEPWFWVSIGGSLVSTSIVLFFIRSPSSTSRLPGKEKLTSCTHRAGPLQHACFLAFWEPGTLFNGSTICQKTHSPAKTRVLPHNPLVFSLFRPF